MGRKPVKQSMGFVSRKRREEEEEVVLTKPTQSTYQSDPGRVRSMSIKLDADRYRRLSRARFDLDLTAQDIFIEALDLWFRAKKL
jgi:hypothetical protein